jgi:hypothetical protein
MSHVHAVKSRYILLSWVKPLFLFVSFIIYFSIYRKDLKLFQRSKVCELHQHSADCWPHVLLFAIPHPYAFSISICAVTLLCDLITFHHKEVENVMETAEVFSLRADLENESEVQ